MYGEHIRLYNTIKRAENDIYFEYDVSKVDLGMLCSLSTLILSTGSIWHGRERIMRNAFKPYRSASYYASLYKLVDRELVIVKIKSNGYEWLTLSVEGLTIVERFDLRLGELFDSLNSKIKTDDTIHDIIGGVYK